MTIHLSDRNDVFEHTAASYNLEGSAGSLPDLVQLVLQGIDLSFHLVIGGAIWRDEHTPAWFEDSLLESNSDNCRIVWGSRSDVQLKSSDYVHGLISWVSVPYQFGTAAGSM
jgi:hypothetical protein